MKKVLFLSALLIALVSLSASAAYLVNWTDNFEEYTLGGLAGQNGNGTSGNWLQVDAGTQYADTDLEVVNTQNHTVGGSQSAMQRPAAFSSSELNFTDGQWATVGFNVGYAKFWVYEPGTAGASSQFQAGVYGRGVGTGTTPWVGSVTNNFIALTMRDSTTKDFWMCQWAGDIKKADGTVSSSAASYKWTSYRSAPRRATAGWSWVMVYWNFDLAAGSGYATYYVNNTSPTMRVDFDSTAAASGNRWKSTTPIIGLVAGQTTSTVSSPKIGYIDDIEFHGNIVPEPGSLLAIGTGLIGLVGLIRRKR